MSQGACQAEIQEHWDLLKSFPNQIEILTERFKPFLQYKRQQSRNYLMIMIVTCTSLSFLSYPAFVKQGSIEFTSPPPTTTEVFHLRSECAVLGRKILDSHQTAPSTAQYEISHYEPRTNRCYVRLDRVSLENTTSDYSRLLFDGQTGESLAFVEAKNTNKIGRVTQGEVGWDKANEYIDAMMADDRKQ